LELAREVIDDIFARGKVPIVVGGTGLYVQALVEGFFLDQRSKIKDQNDISKIKNREQLDNLTIEQLRAMLKQTNPAVYNEIDLKNRYRIIRAIERTQEGFKPIKKKPDFEVLQIGLNLERKELYKKIDDRVEERFEKGMLEEMINLLRAGISIDWMIKIGLEYKIIGRFVWEHSPISCLKNKGNSKFQASDPKQIQNFNDQVTNVATPRSLDILKIADDLKKLPEYEAMKQELKWKIHAFARRQLTWFRRFPEIHWLDNYQDIELRIKTFIEK
jgi:tRNA A37 N6-isopentenylltransferase MiaA